jgi:hypothetical protein
VCLPRHPLVIPLPLAAVHAFQTCNEPIKPEIHPHPPDYDDPSSFSFETLLRFKSEVDYQRKLSHHPNVRGRGGRGLGAGGVWWWWWFAGCFPCGLEADVSGWG